MEEQKSYEIKKILKIFSKISDILGGDRTIEYIAATPHEFSLYISPGLSLVLITDLNKLETIMKPDTVFFNENNPQLIISNTFVEETPDEDMEYTMNFIKDCAEYICPCTGSEIHIHQNEIKIFIDQNSLTYDEYIGVYNLFNCDKLIFNIVFDIQRPYIRIASWESMQHD